MIPAGNLKKPAQSKLPQFDPVRDNVQRSIALRLGRLSAYILLNYIEDRTVSGLPKLAYCAITHLDFRVAERHGCYAYTNTERKRCPLWGLYPHHWFATCEPPHQSADKIAQHLSRLHPHYRLYAPHICPGSRHSPYLGYQRGSHCQLREGCSRAFGDSLAPTLVSGKLNGLFHTAISAYGICPVWKAQTSTPSTAV